jgi:hypothetical protein
MEIAIKIDDKGKRIKKFCRVALHKTLTVYLCDGRGSIFSNRAIRAADERNTRASS